MHFAKLLPLVSAGCVFACGMAAHLRNWSPRAIFEEGVTIRAELADG